MDENMVLTDASSGTPSMDLFYAQDGLGTVRQIFDATSSLVNNYDYEGFGTETSTTGALYNRYRFTGREYDAETEWNVSVGTMNYSFNGTYYYRARTYDTTIGSFTSRDPIPYANLYQYCSSDPINLIDPFGLLAETPEEKKEADSHVSVTYKDCEECAQKYITCMLDKIRDMLNTVITKIQNAITVFENSKQSDEGYWEFFGLENALNLYYSFFDDYEDTGYKGAERIDYDKGNHVEALKTINGNLTKMQTFLSNGISSLTCKSKGSLKKAAGKTTNEFNEKTKEKRFVDMEINVSYFCNKLTKDKKMPFDYALFGKNREKMNASTLIHELTHAGFFSDDHNDTNLGDKSKFKKLGLDKRLTLAATYTRFLMEFYPSKPKCELDSECCDKMGESTSDFIYDP